MGTIVYLSIRLACACYILYKVCGQKKKIREICDLLYAKLPPVKQKEPENVLSEPGGESGVMGSTRFVYLDEDEGKSLRAALTLHTIRETDLFEIFSSQVENKNVIDSLMGKYLDGNGNPLPVRKTKSVVPVSDGWKQYL